MRLVRRLTLLLCVFVLLGGQIASAPKRPFFELTLLHNGNGGSRLIAAGGGALADFGGVARFATVVGNLRAEIDAGTRKRDAILLSSGDTFLAGPHFNASLARGVPHYDSVAMSLIGYDAAAIGDHEFDFGPDVLVDFISGFSPRIPFVSANLDFGGEPGLQALADNGTIVASAMFRKKGQLIGVVGAVTPFLRERTSPRNVVANPDVAGAVQAQIDRLQSNAVGIIIVVSHLRSFNEDLALVPMLRGVDVMLSGADELLANVGNLLAPGDVLNPALPYPLHATGADGARVAVVATAGDYKYVGRLIANFDREGNLIDVDPRSGPVRVAGGSNPDAVLPDPLVQAQIVDPVREYVDALATTVIGVSDVALDGRRSPGVRTMETNLGDLIADALFWQAARLAPSFGTSAPEVALQNGGGIRNNSVMSAGPITETNTFEVAPFSNFVSIVPDVPPAQFKEIMENAVSRAEFADGRFAQISGFTLVWDAAGTPQVLDVGGNVVTAGSRVVEIRLADGTYIVQGGALAPGAPSVDVATLDFLARGGDQYPFRGAVFTALGVTYQQALRDYIAVGLGGTIGAAAYPEGGVGRIVRMN